MNQTIKELYERKSVRMYTDEAITEEEKRLILESALQAPTAGNMALYSIIDVQDQSLKDELAIRCDHQPFIAKAPLVLIFLADYQKWFDMFNEYTPGVPQLEESDLFLATQDCIIAAQNAVVAAESLGIGSCYIGDILENFEENQKLLHLPKYAVPFVMVVFGRPTEQQKTRQKPKRFTVEDMVSIDTYHQKTIVETKQMFMKQSGKSEEELGKYISSFAKRKFFAEFRDEMNRSSREMLKHWIK
ncbi:nitroreductase family protein [Candidatus Stoquefichus massiliensis]|uniref:nitroreductase family protein n=1 Tax=Candidatus Stoquefichus massiliensis TaxID=1470350 RepID=UPI00048249F4|nr:nitroreductase family protein [Candidatus Stoquefichus massiliensis]